MEYGATTLNLASTIENHARVTPAKEAVKWNEMTFTYGQLNALANRLANALREMGIGRGDKVALSCPNLPFFPIVYYGILKAGAVVVPLNVLFKPREVAYHLTDSDAKAVFVFEGTPELPLAQMVKEGFEMVDGCENLVVMTVNPTAPCPFENCRTLSEITAHQPETFETVPVKPEETAVILYTSGTTGQPKGAELTHLNMMMNAMIVHELHAPFKDYGENARNATLITLPLFHSTGQTAQMNAHFYGGNVIVLLPRFEPLPVLETFKKEKIKFWIGVPTMYWTLVRYAEENDIDSREYGKSLGLLNSGGAPMPVEVMRRFEELFGARVVEGYGLSETAPVACFNNPARASKPGTVGQALTSVEVKCFDDNDREVPRGERGEVVIRGHNLMKGYYKRPEATAEAFRNGWFHTGDIGIMDEDGFLSIVDRKKDMILRGGYNVYPRELEEVIMTHPAVSLCAVIGVPDERLGEEVKAFVVLKQGANATEEEMLEWFKNQFAANKYPRHVEFCDALPVSATGKILKRELRQQ